MFSEFSVPKIIKIDLFLTELYKIMKGWCFSWDTVTVKQGRFLKHAVFVRTNAEMWRCVRMIMCHYGPFHSIPISTKIRLMKALVWPVATYGCESWTLRKNEETRPDAFEMKGLRKILRVSWTAKKTNEWVLNKAGVEGIVRHRQSKEASIHTMRKQGSCLQKEIM